ncbi:MAG: ADP-ribosylglycohydrolase family protein [Armatimonadota bacterium]|nr:MAG: ADP-ribosylglycohydrolase family protein [Armatimonadota bacterium]
MSNRTPDKPDAGRLVGCLVGLAIGDALGMPAEGLTRHEIHARWGRIADFLPAPDLRAGQYTDDTQMAIAIGESIVRVGRFDADAAAQALSEWWAGGDPRRPGAGTAEACERLLRGAAWRDAGSQSAGCGPVPRAVVIGLLDCRSPGGLVEDVVASSLMTHRDARAVAGAVTIAAAVAHLLFAQGPLDVAAFLDHAAAAAEEHDRRMTTAIRGIPDVLDLPPRLAMNELGCSGLAVEAVPAAVYCFVSTPDDFAESVLLAVNGGGDCDTIAAVTGALSGAYLGLPGIPPAWAEGVEGSQQLQQLAREIHALA